jgi:hypothetical protein
MSGIACHVYEMRSIERQLLDYAHAWLASLMFLTFPVKVLYQCMPPADTLVLVVES